MVTHFASGPSDSDARFAVRELFLNAKRISTTGTVRKDAGPSCARARTADRRGAIQQFIQKKKIAYLHTIPSITHIGIIQGRVAFHF